MISQPFQIRITVYQLAKQRKLKFYYDFLDWYFNHRDFELIQVNMASNYIASSADRLEDIIYPELHAEFKATKMQWLAWDKWSGHTLGLFKLECEGMHSLAGHCTQINQKPEIIFSVELLHI